MEEEEWRDVVGYESSYEVSSYGKIKSIERRCASKNGKTRKVPERIMKPKIDRYGYSAIHLSKNGERRDFTIHRLVALAFIPNPENLPQVNHKDGDKLDNRVDSLEWCSAQYNVQHSFDNGLQKVPCGTDRPFFKMSDEKVREVRKRYATEGISLVKLAKDYDICPQTLHSIILLKTWKHVI